MIIIVKVIMYTIEYIIIRVNYNSKKIFEIPIDSDLPFLLK